MRSSGCVRTEVGDITAPSLGAASAYSGFEWRLGSRCVLLLQFRLRYPSNNKSICCIPVFKVLRIKDLVCVFSIGSLDDNSSFTVETWRSHLQRCPHHSPLRKVHKKDFLSTQTPSNPLLHDNQQGSRGLMEFSASNLSHSKQMQRHDLSAKSSSIFKINFHSSLFSRVLSIRAISQLFPSHQELQPSLGR